MSDNYLLTTGISNKQCGKHQRTCLIIKWLFARSHGRSLFLPLWLMGNSPTGHQKPVTQNQLPQKRSNGYLTHNLFTPIPQYSCSARALFVVFGGRLNVHARLLVCICIARQKQSRDRSACISNIYICDMCSFVRWLPRQSQILREAEAERVTLRRMEDGQQMGTNVP